jgi:hypothetical protein
MNNGQRAISIFIIILSLHGAGLFAQVSANKFEIGMGLNSFIYQGDLTPSRFGSFKTMRAGINIYGSKILGPSFSLRTNLAIGGLRGDDAKYNEPEYRKQRSFNFRSPVAELSELIVCNPLGRNYTGKGLSPYLFAGAGLSLVKIKRDWSNYNAEYFDGVSDVSARLALDAEHSLPRVLPVIPLGAGVRYGISPRLAVHLESSYRLVFNDYLDGFSQAANPKLNDHYHSITAGVVYQIGKKNTLACPIVRN